MKEKHIAHTSTDMNVWVWEVRGKMIIGKHIKTDCE